jgi:hypothetical protein
MPDGPSCAVAPRTAHVDIVTQKGLAVFGGLMSYIGRHTLRKNEEKWMKLNERYVACSFARRD